MAKRIACVVEGHGDVEATPILIRRIAERYDPNLVVQVSAPVRTPKSRLIKPGELERSVEFAARRLARTGAVLVLIDADDDCPAQLGPQLLNRATAAGTGLPVGVVLAKREVESWFIAAAQSIAGHAGLPHELQPPNSPETIRGAKEWLTAKMTGTRSYSATLDQPVLAGLFSVDAALQADSFGKFQREVERLLQQAPDAW